ncbi:VanZ family protein [Photobacterium sp. BZF1]|uniref:VanZ family protein n=1 Tax=Photobacterium sp. BZF1 TaxID=1904457 RepID=UPI0016537867|nr:VanZ family protein [Photobacterium sp. BZF1]MBC7006733.1 VanZ family protein [Photobacterium sp. BZF1]
MIKKIPLLLYALLILFLSLKPNGPELVSIPHIDKVQHFIAYAVFAIVAAYAVATKRAFYRYGLAIVLFSGGIEILQPYFGRECSLFDLLANSLGVALGMFIVSLVNNKQVWFEGYLNLD